VPGCPRIDLLLSGNVAAFDWGGKPVEPIGQRGGEEAAAVHHGHRHADCRVRVFEEL
jgi:hypothetical protein